MADAPTEPTQLPPAGADDVLYVVDISSYIFRAYHALPPLSSSRGEPTHAVKGVTQMLLKLVKERQPSHLIIAHDARGASVRKDRYPEYKANRDAPPPDLSQQIDRVREVVSAWGMCPLELEGYEADDVIATVVRKARQSDLRVVIVSADKDLLQLIQEGVVMYDTMRENVFGEPETIAKMGVPPEQVRDLLALMGDSSDNVPGVPSIGAKSAAKLLAEYGHLDGVYDGLDSLTRKAQKKKLIEFKEQAYLSQELVTLHDDIDVPFTVKAATFDGGDGGALRKIFSELEFTRVLAQLDPAPTVQGHYEVIRDATSMHNAGVAIRHAARLSFRSVLSDDDPLVGDLVGVALSWADGVGVYLPVGHRTLDGGEQLEREALIAFVAPLLANSLLPKVMDVKRERQFWDRLGLVVRGDDFDTMIASYLLEPGRRGHDISEVARAELGADIGGPEAILGKGKKRIGYDEADIGLTAGYVGQLVDYQLRLWSLLGPRMDHGDFGHLMYGIELPLARLLARLEATGIRLDSALLESMSEEAAGELTTLEARCTELAGHEFNVSSPRQLETILFDELELPVIKKTKTARSTDADVLEELALQHELPRVILEYRSIAKLKNTYLDALPRVVRESTGRVHTKYNQAVAATGRLSSSDPNLQNIPIRTEMGRRVRDAFIPEEGWLMMSADYSQVELRVLAHLSGDEQLVEAFTTGSDVHRRTASALFDVPEDEVDREQRGQAKTVNFAVIYGQTQFALARNLGIERREAKRYIDAFFERYAGVREYMDSLVELAHQQGYVSTLLGRRRGLNDIRSRNRHLRAGAERIARNTPIQGTAADIIKIAMIRVQDAIDALGLRTRMLLTVHDELVFEVPPDERDQVEALVRENMEGAIELSVPLVVESGWGPNWGAAH